MDFFDVPRIFDHISVDTRKNLSISLDSPEYAKKKAGVEKHGRSHLALADMDCVFLVGTLPFRITTKFLKMLAETDIEGMRETSNRMPMISRTEARTYLETRLRDHLPAKIWHHWDAPGICVVERPRRAALILKDRQPLRPLLQDTTGLAAFLDLATEVHRELLAAIGIDLVTHPKETLTACGLTDFRFTRAARLLSGNINLVDRTTDTVHMNVEYGALQLAEMAEYVARLHPKRPMGVRK